MGHEKVTYSNVWCVSRLYFPPILSPSLPKADQRFDGRQSFPHSPRKKKKKHQRDPLCNMTVQIIANFQQLVYSKYFSIGVDVESLEGRTTNYSRMLTAYGRQIPAQSPEQQSF